jgi:hypothetical protein
MQGKPVEGTGVEQDGSHESARRKLEDHDSTRMKGARIHINEPFV